MANENKDFIKLDDIDVSILKSLMKMSEHLIDKYPVV